MPRPGSTTARGYGPAHQAERERLRPTVDAGHAYCAEPRCLQAEDGYGRWIEPGTPWDLAHNRATGDYHGPAHARCNRSEAATYRNTHHPTPPFTQSRDWL